MAGGRRLAGLGAAGAVEQHAAPLRPQLVNGLRGRQQLPGAEALDVGGDRPVALFRGERREHVAQGDVELVAEGEAEPEAQRGLVRPPAQQEGAALAEQGEIAARRIGRRKFFGRNERGVEPAAGHPMAEKIRAEHGRGPAPLGAGRVQGLGELEAIAGRVGPITNAAADQGHGGGPATLHQQLLQHRHGRGRGQGQEQQIDRSGSQGGHVGHTGQAEKLRLARFHQHQVAHGQRVMPEVFPDGATDAAFLRRNAGERDPPWRAEQIEKSGRRSQPGRRPGAVAADRVERSRLTLQVEGDGIQFQQHESFRLGHARQRPE